MGKLERKVVLVTGASSGIGQAIVERLVEEGAFVAAAARREDRLRELADRQENVLPVVADVTNEADVRQMVERACVHWGKDVEIVVNNAGLGKSAKLWDGKTEDWRKILETNLLSPMVVTRELMARSNELSHLVFTSSMAAHRVTTYGGMYAASKAGLRTLVGSLRKQLREAESKVRVTLISPGWVETEFMHVSLGDAKRAKKHWQTMEALQPVDVADAVIYAVSAPARCDVNDILLRPSDQAE